jgi:hypothetical protein
MPRLRFFALQLREEHDVADAFGTGEHHDEAVDADADAAGGWHAVFEGGDELFVDLLRLFAGLMFQALALDDGVVQFGVSRADFLTPLMMSS